MKPVINEDRTEVRLGLLTFEWDRKHSLLQVAKYDEEVFATGEVVTEELWESFVCAVERLAASGPLLSALQQIDQLARDKRGGGTSEERAVQVVGRVVGIVRQVLDEYERTSPPREDERHVSTLDASSSIRGVAPEEVMAALHYESERMSAKITVINWQVTEVDGDRIVYVIYSFKGESVPVAGELKPREGLRAAIHVNDIALCSYELTD